MPETATTVAEHVRKTIADELELFDVLVVTDTADLRPHHEAGRMPNARLVVVDDPAAPLTDADKLVLEIARAGKLVRTWCSLTEGGRRIAHEAAQTLNPHFPDDARVLHITDPPPHAWQSLVDPFRDLVNGARARLPAAVAKKPARRDRRRGGPAWFDTDPESLAQRIILNFGAELLIVAPPVHDRKGFSTGFALDEHGIWCAAGDIWARWLVKISHKMRVDALDAGLDDKALPPTLAAISRIKNPRMIEPVQQMLDAALRELREKGEPCPDVTTCPAEHLDADLQYLGAANGVVDLHTGELVEPEQARGHLVTLRCPVEYHPDATHPALDKLFAAWSPRLMGWWKGVLGHSLRGLPKRLYFAVGPPDSGKSTLGTALSKVLGRHMRTAAPDVLQKRNRSSETQLTPGLRVWHRPTRIVWINEIKETAINERLTKDLSGGGDRLAARGLHEDLVEEDVTATTFATCNPESIPQLKLTDSGMRSRYKELRYPKATTLDPGLKPTLCNDPGAQRALLAWLVAAAVAAPVEPDDVPEVHAATIERIRDDAGEIGEFARRIVRGDGVLTVAQVWHAWCEHNGEPMNAQAPGGIGRRSLSKALSDHIFDLGKPRQITVDGNNVRGWRGWRLLTEEEAQRATAEQAEKTQPAADYAPSPEAEQAIRDLLADFPDDFVFQGVTLGRRTLYDCLLQLSKDRLLSLRYVYQDGHHLAEHLQKYEPPTISVDSMKQVFRDRDDGTLAGWLLSLSIHFLASEADHKRPAGPAYEQAKARFKSMTKTTAREESALSRLLGAARQLDSVEANTEVLAQKAIELSVEGSDSTQKQRWERWFDADVEAAIKELLGLKEPLEERDYLGAASWPQAMFNMLVEKAKQVRQNRESGKGHYNRMALEPIHMMLIELARLETLAVYQMIAKELGDVVADPDGSGSAEQG